MDKDKFTAGPSSWLEMNNFISDLMASRASSSAQLLKYSNQQAICTTWGTAGAEPPVPKLSQLNQGGTTSQNQRKNNTAGNRRTSRERTEEPHDHHIRSYACTCPGCPLSSVSSAASTLTALLPKPRDASFSQLEIPRESPFPPKEPSSVPHGLGSCVNLALEDRNSEPSSTSNPGLQDKGTSTHSPTLSPNSSPQICPASVQGIPCFCCHPCPHLLHPQQASEPRTHSHLHYHHHHHHCSLAACLLCQHPASPLQEGHGQHQHPCVHCSASFMRPSQQHQRTQHSKVGSFVCPECGRVFNSHSNLRVHLNVHTGARPYICAECGKSFSQSGALKIHRRMHTGERPYTCTYCGRGFPHLAGIRAHQRIHTGEKPYRCAQCGKAFTQSGALKVHIRVHTGERPFICGECGKGFSNRSGVRFHQRTAHGIITEPNSVGRPSLANCDPDPQQKQASVQPTEQSRKSPEEEEARRTLPYACEDCGMRFQDAPSRNKHQELQHYSTEEEQGEGHGTGPEAHIVGSDLI